MRINAFVVTDSGPHMKSFNKPVKVIRFKLMKMFNLGRHTNTTLVDGKVVWNFKNGIVCLSGDVIVKHGYRTAA